MNIQSKLSVTYVLLLLIGIITISAYAILSIRFFLFAEGLDEFKNDMRIVRQAVESSDENTDFFPFITETTALFDYDLALFDSTGIPIYNTQPEQVFVDSREFLSDLVVDSVRANNEDIYIMNDPDYSRLVAFAKVDDGFPSVSYLRISKDKEEYYEAVDSIRHIIYAGMLFSIAAVMVVSFIFSKYMAAPIKQLNDAALTIADGQTHKTLEMDRNDEFGTLASSLNKMAERFKRDNRQLQSLNEKQNQFFADIAHEVRNPLHTISGTIEMLQLENISTEKKSQYMVTMQNQVERVVRLFNDIKMLQRYDMDEHFIEKKAVEVASFLKHVITTYEALAQEKNIELSLIVERDALVFIDRDKLYQVMDNLIMNALKYTNEGSIKVLCKQIENRIQISVEDTGIGIASEHLDRLFDRFYRTDKARSRDKGGTGLGLAVVRGILAAHETNILVTSEIGVGSRFYFELPVIT